MLLPPYHPTLHRYYLMVQSGVVASANLHPVKLARFLRAVEDGYRPNPYHSKASCTCSLRILISRLCMQLMGVMLQLPTSLRLLLAPVRTTRVHMACAESATPSLCSCWLLALPPHMQTHAADVVQTMHMIVMHGGMAPLYTDQTTLLACYMAACVHDYEHVGLTNDFLVKSGDQLARVYNDRSVGLACHAWLSLTGLHVTFSAGSAVACRPVLAAECMAY